jgi:hypothetical protein
MRVVDHTKYESQRKNCSTMKGLVFTSILVAFSIPSTGAASLRSGDFSDDELGRRLAGKEQTAPQEGYLFTMADCPGR